MNVQQNDEEKKGRIAIIIEEKNHSSTIDNIGGIQAMVIERKGGKAPYPTTIAIDAINYLHTGMARGVTFVEPFQPNDPTEVEIAKAVDYYRKGCIRGVQFSE